MARRSSVFGPRSAGLRLEFIDPLQDGRWDRLTEGHRDATVFHCSAWARVLHDCYGFQPRYAVLSAAAGPVAALPLMEVRGLFTGRRAIALPFSDACPALFFDGAQANPAEMRSHDGLSANGAGSSPGLSPDNSQGTDGSSAASALWSLLVEHATARRWRFIELRGAAPPQPAVQPSLTHFAHTLDLSPGPSALFARFDPAVRRAIRKAERQGVTVQVQRDRDAMRAYYQLHCETRRRHGLPPQPLRFFDLLWQHTVATDRGAVVLAQVRGDAAAAAVFLQSGDRVVFKFGASRADRLRQRANDAVMWHAIRHFAEGGFRTLDFGRTSLSNAGLRRFKRGWGTVESAQHDFRYDVDRGCFVQGRDLSSGWHTRLFRALPVPLARWLGALGYRWMT